MESETRENGGPNVVLDEHGAPMPPSGDLGDAGLLGGGNVSPGGLGGSGMGQMGGSNDPNTPNKRRLEDLGLNDENAAKRRSMGDTINSLLGNLTIFNSCVDRMHMLYTHLHGLADGVCLMDPYLPMPMPPDQGAPNDFEASMARRVQFFLNASECAPAGLYVIQDAKHIMENGNIAVKFRIRRIAPHNPELHHKLYVIDRALLCATCNAALHFVNGGSFLDRELSHLALSKPEGKRRRFDSCSVETTLWWRQLVSKAQALPRGKTKLEDREEYATAQTLLKSQLEADASLSKHMQGPLKKLREAAGVKRPLTRSLLREEQDRVIVALDSWLDPLDPETFDLDDTFMDKLYSTFKELGPSWLDVIKSSMALNNDSRNTVNTRKAKMQKALVRLITVFQQRSERELIPFTRLMQEYARKKHKKEGATLDPFRGRA